MKRIIAFLVLFTMVPFVYGAHEFVPIQERAQGQSLVGANTLNDSIFSNPAGSAFLQTYAVSGEFLRPKAFSASILDTKSSGVGGGFAYFRQPFNGSDEISQGGKISLFGKLSDWIAVGAAGKAIWGPKADGQKSSMKDVDLGLLFRFNPMSFGMLVRNVFGGSPYLQQGQEWGYGARFEYEQMIFLSAAALTRWDTVKPYQYGFGFEYASPYYFSLKGGYRFQPDLKKSFWSAGLSFTAPRIAFHYAVEFPTHNNDQTEHMIGTTLMF